jgi:hypothetical protein
MGLFSNIRLSDVATGAIQTIDEGLKQDFNTLTRRIEKFGDELYTRDLKTIDDINSETEKVLEKLRRAQEVLGGTDDPESATRAAALLKSTGNVTDFDSLISEIKQARKDNPNFITYDFTKYFDGQMDMPDVNLDDAARNFVMQTRLPTDRTQVAIREPGEGRNLAARLYGVDVNQQVREFADQKLAGVGVTMPEATDMDLPTIEFKAEAFRLDKMTADEEIKYLMNALRNTDLPDDKISFYTQRLSGHEANADIDTRLRIATNRYNLADNQTERDEAASSIETLNREKEDFAVFTSGDPQKVAAHELSKALETGNFDGIKAANEKLVNLGVKTMDEVLEQQENFLLAQLNMAQTNEDTDDIEDINDALDDIRVAKSNLKTAKEKLTPQEDFTAAEINTVTKTINNEVIKNLRRDPELAKVDITFTTLGEPVYPTGMGTAAQELYTKKYNEYLSQAYTKYSGSQIDPRTRAVVSFIQSVGTETAGAVSAGENVGGETPAEDTVTAPKDQDVTQPATSDVTQPIFPTPSEDTKERMERTGEGMPTPLTAAQVETVMDMAKDALEGGLSEDQIASEIMETGIIPSATLPDIATAVKAAITETAMDAGEAPVPSLRSQEPFFKVGDVNLKNVLTDAFKDVDPDAAKEDEEEVPTETPPAPADIREDAPILSDQAVAEYVSTLDPSLGQAEKIDKLMDRFRITDVNQAVRMFNRASEQRVVARESSLLAAARRIANGTADENDYTMVTEFLETGGDQENRFRTTRKINAILNQGQQTNE